MLFLRGSRCLSLFRFSNPARRQASTSSKPFYITTPIFYPNASPHIGHLYSLVTADVFARYQRAKSRDADVRFLAGTDEHGLKIQKAARTYFSDESGREKEFCDMLSERFRDLGKRANISNTCFMRTSSKEHHTAVEDVWRKLYAKGYIYKARYSGWYSITDECFYTDSQVADGASLETGSTVEWTEEENYMFRLSAFRNALLEHYSANPKSVYPEQYLENVVTMLGGALVHPPANDGSPLKVALVDSFVAEDISISRPRSRLEWGVQVPDDPEQTVYVWFDALLIYLTGTGYPWATIDQQGGWPADIQVIGKDILRFHAIYLPAILMALSGKSYSPSASSSSDIPSTSIPLAKTLLTHAHWTSSQKKMSKSLGNVADPIEAMEKHSADIVRFYMMRIGGRWRGDVDWSASQLEKHKKEISGQLGNYFLRITSPRIGRKAKEAFGQQSVDGQSLLASSSAGEVPTEVRRLYEPGKEQTPNTELLSAVLELPAKFRSHMDQLEAGQALAEVISVLKLANKTITTVEPWSEATSPLATHTTRVIAFETLRVTGVCLGPFMPETSKTLLSCLSHDANGCPIDDPSGSKGVLEIVDDQSRGLQEEVEAIWKRWNGRKIRAVKLFV